MWLEKEKYETSCHKVGFSCEYFENILFVAISSLNFCRNYSNFDRGKNDFATTRCILLSHICIEERLISWKHVDRQVLCFKKLLSKERSPKRIAT